MVNFFEQASANTLVALFYCRLNCVAYYLLFALVQLLTADSYAFRTTNFFARNAFACAKNVIEEKFFVAFKAFKSLAKVHLFQKSCLVA
jgi:hypothetical protein